MVLDPNNATQSGRQSSSGLMSNLRPRRAPEDIMRALRLLRDEAVHVTDREKVASSDQHHELVARADVDTRSPAEVRISNQLGVELATLEQLQLLRVEMHFVELRLVAQT